MNHIFSMLAVLLLLLGYFINNTKVVSSVYIPLWLNIFGSFILMVVAIMEHEQYAFIILEAVWLIITIYGLIKEYRK